MENFCRHQRLDARFVDKRSEIGRLQPREYVILRETGGIQGERLGRHGK
jgi:hypothetical protein